MRVDHRLLGRARRLVAILRRQTVDIRFGRVMAEMLGCTARFVLTIGSDHAPAKL